MFIDGLNFATRVEIDKAMGKLPTLSPTLSPTQVVTTSPTSSPITSIPTKSPTLLPTESPICPSTKPVCPTKECPTIQACPIGSSIKVPAIQCEANETCCGECPCCVNDDDPFSCVKPVRNCWEDKVDGISKKCDGGILVGPTTDVEACKKVCANSITCVGIYYNSKTLDCYTTEFCNTISQSEGFTVYRLDRDCLDCETALVDNANKSEYIEGLELEIARLKKKLQ